MIYLIAKKYIKKFYGFNQIQNPNILRLVSQKLKPLIYLDKDFVIYKNQVGNEMFFIVNGSVHILDNCDLRKLSILKDTFFGEYCLLRKQNKRKRSVISQKISQIYSLKKDDFYEIFNNYPLILKQFLETMQVQFQNQKEIEKILNYHQDIYQASDLNEISFNESSSELSESNKSPNVKPTLI
jgi:F-box and leucine-rich repeat protein 7